MTGRGPSTARASAAARPADRTAEVLGFHTRLRGPEAALRALVGAAPADVRPVSDDPAARVEAWTRLVHASLAHGEPPPLTWRRNWLAAAVALLRPDVARPQRPRALLHGGRALCDGAVVVLAALCRRDGLDVEALDLGGHVVARVRSGAAIWIADPDFGLVHPGDVDALASPAGLDRARVALHAAGHPPAKVDEVAREYARARAARVLPGDTTSPRLARLERWLELGACLLPVAAVLAAALWLLLPRVVRWAN